MSVVQRLIDLDDKHTVSSDLEKTPDIIFLSPELWKEYDDELLGPSGQHETLSFRGKPIYKVPGMNILVVGFKEK